MVIDGERHVPTADGKETEQCFECLWRRPQNTCAGGWQAAMQRAAAVRLGSDLGAAMDG